MSRIDPQFVDAAAGGVAPTEASGRTQSEGPHLASSTRRRNILLAVIFLPPLGAALAWVASDWPTWARVTATVWSLLVLGMALGLALDVFGPRDQGNVSAAVGLLVAGVSA
jgi:hypothetical protein